jgi:hypothetical protein
MPRDDITLSDLAMSHLQLCFPCAGAMALGASFLTLAACDFEDGKVIFSPGAWRYEDSV